MKWGWSTTPWKVHVILLRSFEGSIGKGVNPSTLSIQLGKLPCISKMLSKISERFGICSSFSWHSKPADRTEPFTRPLAPAAWTRNKERRTQGPATQVPNGTGAVPRDGRARLSPFSHNIYMFPETNKYCEVVCPARTPKQDGLVFRMVWYTGLV